jgi:hypothetical protein
LSNLMPGKPRGWLSCRSSYAYTAHCWFVYGTFLQSSFKKYSWYTRKHQLVTIAGSDRPLC